MSDKKPSSAKLLDDLYGQGGTLTTAGSAPASSHKPKTIEKAYPADSTLAAASTPAPSNVSSLTRLPAQWQEYAVVDEYLSVPLEHIRVSPLADRWVGEQDYVTDMADSFAEVQQLQPSIGRIRQDEKTQEAYIELLAGIMRFRGKEQTGEPLRVYVIDVDDAQAVKIIVEENRRRRNPSLYSDSLEMQKLLDGKIMDRKAICEFYKITEGNLTKCLAYAELPEEVALVAGPKIHRLSLRLGYPLSRLAKSSKNGIKHAKQAMTDILAGTITKPEQITALVDGIKAETQAPKPAPKVYSFTRENRKIGEVKEHPDGKVTMALTDRLPAKARREIVRQVKALLKEHSE